MTCHTNIGRPGGAKKRSWPDESSPDAASWSSAMASEPVSEPRVMTSRTAPRMTYMPWRRTQGVDLGATAVDAWYYRCPRPGCRQVVGPYQHSAHTPGESAMDAGLQHLRDLCAKRPRR